MKKFKKIILWVILIYFVIFPAIFWMTDLTSNIGSRSAGSSSPYNGEDAIKAPEWKSPTEGWPDPTEGWELPPWWLELYNQTQ